ncbi:hypothetical protein AYI70_g6079 [Smittium culicis]|uniref:Copper transporter n=1 Tax=Smittium culicis TaxID=133412 RepID=A0A1R1XRP9_9FUNG|nr:hypothetical protein AYI70_g6079 [Smittium culicis]
MNIVTRADPQAVYVNFVFYAFFLRTTLDFARAYIAMILLGVLERTLSLVFDLYPLRIGKLWYMTFRAPIYLAVTIIRYVLMIAIMGGQINIFMVICCGLTLGQIFVELYRYYILNKKLKMKSKLFTIDSPPPHNYNNYDDLSHTSSSQISDIKHPAVKGQALVDESCC